VLTIIVAMVTPDSDKTHACRSVYTEENVTLQEKTAISEACGNVALLCLTLFNVSDICNTAFRKLDVFPSSGVTGEKIMLSLLQPLRLDVRTGPAEQAASCNST
jgi:hypothetical protein